LEWEQLIARVVKEEGHGQADKLLKFQENPTGYLESRRRDEDYFSGEASSDESSLDLDPPEDVDEE
jgi:hypothetical protein